MAPSIRRAISAIALAAALPFGCRAVLGVEDREFDPALSEDALSCEAYCDKIMANCAGPQKQQYASREACLGLCSTFPRGKPGDTSGDTLGCRLTMATIATEVSDCVAAGPAGNDVCGSNCESFCTSALAVCPAIFSGIGDCMSVCAGLPSCSMYHVDPATTPNDPSIQCRIFHLTAGAIGLPADAGMTTSQMHHCPHVAGIGECVVPAGGATCASDGGS